MRCKNNSNISIRNQHFKDANDIYHQIEYLIKKSNNFNEWVACAQIKININRLELKFKINNSK